MIYDKPTFTNPPAFSTVMSGLVEESRAVDVVYLNRSRVLASVSQTILMNELMKYRLRKGVENQLRHCLRRLGSAAPGPAGSQGVAQESVLGLCRCRIENVTRVLSLDGI